MINQTGVMHLICKAAGVCLLVLSCLVTFSVQGRATEKIQLKYAKRFKVDYQGPLIEVEVNEPWRDCKQVFRYTFIKKGLALPEGVKEADVIRTPIKKVITLSTTMHPPIELLGRIESLVGVANFSRINSEVVQKRIKEGKMREIGRGKTINVELIYELDPDIVLTYAIGATSYDTHPKLEASGIPYIMMASYMEDTMLGKAEWIKFFALLYGLEAEANREFEHMSSSYEALRKKVAQVKKKPRVFFNAMYSGVWHQPSGRSMFANLAEDAGAHYIWRDKKVSGSIQLDFESVLDKAMTTEFWLLAKPNLHSLTDVKNEDERYQLFEAYKKKKVYNNNNSINGTGGNNFFELGIIKPHLVLADLIKVFHPQLVKNHEFVFYKHLKAQ